MRELAFVPLLAILACSSPSKSDTTSRKASVEISELPASHAQLLAAYGRGGDEWEGARERALADPELSRFLVENLTIELVRAHRALGGADTARARRAFDRAENELVRCGETAVPTLVGMLEVADPVGASAAAGVLERIGRPATLPVGALLTSAASETRRRAAQVLAKLPHAGPAEAPLRERLIEISEHDPEWVVRAEVAKTLGARGAHDSVSDPWRNALLARLLDDDVAVYEAAAAGLAQLRDPRSVPRLIDALERTAAAGDLRRFQATQAALVRVSGQNEKRSIAEWRAWWESASARKR